MEKRLYEREREREREREMDGGTGWHFTDLLCH